MRINIELNSLEELEDLKKALGVNAVNELTAEPVQQFTPQAPAPQPVPPQVAQQPMPSAAQAFAPQSPQSPQPVPTSAIQYTQDDLVRAAMPLMDAGKQQELVELLRGFGVFSLPELKQEQYGPFVAKLREMGANI